MALVSRFFDIPEQTCFLFGPRGTGKSTWLRHCLPDALFVDLLDPVRHRSLEARPERLRELLAGAQLGTVVIDEIQRVPALLTVVHAMLEEPSPPRFVLTGSSARKLRRGGVDLLGGRAVQCTLHPFMAAELPAFDWPAHWKRACSRWCGARRSQAQRWRATRACISTRKCGRRA